MSSYHSGERAAQARAGLSEQAEFSRRAIGDSIPDVAAQFLREQPMLILGAADEAGRLWATRLIGQPGFLHTEDPKVLAIDALPGAGDPLADRFEQARSRDEQVRIGAIAIEPATRRRMRLNGRATVRACGLRLELDQVIANCPKYLQKRELVGLPSLPDREPEVTDGTMLSRAQQLTIEMADTFFVATASATADADASHRGGNPGFIEVLSPTRLRWPDYVGNAMFLTLGNLSQNPAAGLLIPDWDTGSSLHLSGTATVDWEPGEAVPGAQRLVDFTLTRVRQLSAPTALRWGPVSYSRFNPSRR